MAVRVLTLGSCSSGNATLVEFGRERVLVDAGLSARELTNRLHTLKVDPRSLRCILLSHEHLDHARGAQRFSVAHGVPVASTPETLEAMNLSPRHLAAWQPLDPGQRLDMGGLWVDSFPVPHDAANPVGFVVQAEGVRVAIATDLGHASALVVERMKGCHVLVVESNHDAELLRSGPYPWHLKQRVAGRTGHLSNDEAAALLASVVDDECRGVVLAHLSEKNNRPALARAAAARALSDVGLRRYEMRVAEARRPGIPLVL